MRFSIIVVPIAVALAAPAQARVVSSQPNGFVVEQSVNLATSQAAAWSLLSHVGDWWVKEHSYSGDAANLSLDTRPGGCLCERFPAGGGIEHMTVVLVEPGEKIVLTGALGPLLGEAVNGVLEIEVKKAGAGAKLSMRYKASGFASANADKFAAAVDKVIGQQAQSFARRAAGAR